MSLKVKTEEKCIDLKVANTRKGDEGMEERVIGSIENLKEKKWSNNETTFWRGVQTYGKLPPALYKMSVTNTVGPMLVRQNVVTDDLLILPDRENVEILDEFDLFWKQKKEFLKRGFTYKRGILLFGPPGSGKTSAIQLLIKDLIDKKGGIVLFADEPQVAGHCLQMIRDIEPDRPMIVVFEDIDALIYKHGENEYLALLDGEAQVDNVVFLATTNYPERLDKRFIDRPSRFDILFEVPMPSDDARDMYLSVKEPSLSEKERRDWVQETDGFSIAHLKELIISIKCIGRPFHETITRLRKMIEEEPKSDKFKDTSVGFTSGRTRDCDQAPETPSWNPTPDPQPYPNVNGVIDGG